MAEHSRSPFESSSGPAAYREHLEPVIFRPWAQRLIGWVGLTPGQSVLDVASGTGVVARAAASTVGPTGAVLATDLSPAMLTQVHLDADPAGAPIATLVCPAEDLAVPEGSVDVVFCQQGLHFFPDRAAAVREMHRVLRAGGTVGVAVWSTSARAEPFDTYSEVLDAAGVDPPFPGAFRHAAHSMSADDVRDLLVAGGFRDVEVRVESIALDWASPQAAALAVAGSFAGSCVAALDPDRRAAVMEALEAALTGGDGAVHQVSTAVLARGSTA